MDDAARLLTALRTKNRAMAEKAARSLRKLAELEPDAFTPHAAELVKLTMADQDLRIRWNLIQVLGKLTLKPKLHGVAVDWLIERLGDPSPFTRTFALQALFDLSTHHEPLRQRLRPIAQEFAENGTAAMRARSRKLLKAASF
jgi:hypothetical protein